MALTQAQFARHGQAVLPALFCRWIFIVLIRHAHPANQNLTAFMCQHLRRVEIKALVQFLELGVLHHIHAVQR